MIKKKLMIPLSIIVMFCFSGSSIASNLHLGIIKAIESRTGNLQVKIWTDRTTYIEATTSSDGTTVVHDNKNNVDITVSTVDDATGMPIEGVDFEYINTGNTILVIAKNASGYFPGFTIQPTLQSNQSVKGKEPVVATGLVLTLATVALSAYGLYDLFFEDPPYTTILAEDPGWTMKQDCMDLDDALAMITAIPFVNFKTAWAKFALAAGKLVGKNVAEDALRDIGLDPYKKHCYVYYELKSDPTVKASFISIKEDNEPPQAAILELRFSPGTVHINEIFTVSIAISETNGVGVNFEKFVVTNYDTENNVFDEWEEGQDWIDQEFGTHYLPGNSTFYAEPTFNSGPIPGRSVGKLYGTDDNGHEAMIAGEIKVLE